MNSEIRKLTKEALNFPCCSFRILLLTADSDLTLKFCGNVAHLLKRRCLSQVFFFNSSELKFKFPLFYFSSLFITSYSSVWLSLLFYRIREELLKWKSFVRLASCLMAVMKRRVEIAGMTFEVICNWASLDGYIDCLSIHSLLFGSVGWFVIVRGQNNNINYGMDTTGEKEKRTSKKNVDGRSTSNHDNKKLRTRSMEKEREMSFGFR